MIRKLFSIRDAKAEAFNLPFSAHTNGEAERQLLRMRNDPQTMVAQFPDDYDLYYLGEFNDQDGKMALMDTPLHLAKASLIQKA